MIRLHVDDALAEGARLALGPEASRYLLTVMRQRVGDALLLFNGQDGEWRARLAEAGKRGAVLEVEGLTRVQVLGPDLDLLIAVVKRPRLETVVEKAAELGARRVRLVVTRRTNADRANVARLQAIATEAAEQTGRLDVPEVLAPERLDRILADWTPDRTLIFCDEAGDALPMLHALSPPLRSGGGGSGRRPETEGARPADSPPQSVRSASCQLPRFAGEQTELNASPPQSPPLRSGGGGSARSAETEGASSFPVMHGLSHAILIGPEGGFDPAERDQLRGLPFTTAVSLGPRILRADTAAISALTLWQAAAGDWRA